MHAATEMTANNNTDAELAYGSGHINPLKARFPGLVYDLGVADYVSFLCGQGYSNKNLQLITGDNSTCSTAKNTTVYDLNYPSFAVSTLSGGSVSHIFHRTVSNVGFATSRYQATVVTVPGLSIQVQPSTLSFTSLGQQQNFTVTVTANVTDTVLSGSLYWFDSVYVVRSPVVAFSA